MSLAELWAAIGGGATLAALLKLISIVLDMLKARQTAKALAAPLSNKPILDEYKLETGAMHTLLLRAQNGGKKILTDSPTFSWVVCTSEGAEAVQGRWQGQHIDATYSDILAQTINQGFCWVITSELPVGCYLHNVYTSLSVECALVFAVRTDSRKKILYTSAVFDRVITDPTTRAVIQDEARFRANQIRSIYP